MRLFNSLGTIRVEFFDPSGQQMSLPLSCTTLAGEDPSIHFSDGQGFFRVPDLFRSVSHSVLDQAAHGNDLYQRNVTSSCEMKYANRREKIFAMYIYQ